MAEAMSDTITTSDIFQYFSTAMHDSHSLILNMIQQIEKNSFKLFFTRSGWLEKNIKVNTTSGKIQYFFQSYTLGKMVKLIIKSVWLKKTINSKHH